VNLGVSKPDAISRDKFEMERLEKSPTDIEVAAEIRKRSILFKAARPRC
jgi:hypothetical protein